MSLFRNSVTKKITDFLLETDGSANVVVRNPSDAAQLRSRVATALGTSKKLITFPLGSDVKDLYIIAVRGAGLVGTTPDSRPYAIITFDAANATEADENMGTSGAPPEALTSDSGALILPLDKPMPFPQTAAITKIYARNSTNVAEDLIDLWVGAN